MRHRTRRVFCILEQRSPLPTGGTQVSIRAIMNDGSALRRTVTIKNNSYSGTGWALAMNKALALDHGLGSPEAVRDYYLAHGYTLSSSKARVQETEV